jgi:hypothetical protein
MCFNDQRFHIGRAPLKKMLGGLETGPLEASNLICWGPALQRKRGFSAFLRPRPGPQSNMNDL